MHSLKRKVVVALDSFKGGLSAEAACMAVAEGLRRADPTVACILRPMADGGEGSIAVLLASRPEAEWVRATVAGPLDGMTVTAGFGNDVRDLPGAGAAGGLGAGAVAFWGAELVSGIERILKAAQLPEALQGAEWCITGEGSFDSQSLDGKVVSGVAQAARVDGVPVVVFAGHMRVDANTCRIPGMIATRNNTVLVTTEARPGQGGDYDFNDLLMRRSTDGGKTFEPFVTLVDHTTYGDGPASNFVMIPDRDSGRIVAVFHHDYARAFTFYSDDEGATWSEPIEVTDVFDQFKTDYPWRVCANGCGRGTQLRNGRMIIPVWLSDGSGTEMGKHRGHRPSVVTLIYSDDSGATWQRGEIVCSHGDTIRDETIINPSETIAVELADGSVLFNIRSESKIHRRLTLTSADGATGWGGHRWDQALLDPVCMASLIRYDWPAGGQPGRILFSNPDNLEQTMTTWAFDRKRLTVKLSRDDAQSWPVSKVLEQGPSGYSALAALPDGTILCLYEADIVTRMCDDRYIRLARFDLDWLQGNGDDFMTW